MSTTNTTTSIEEQPLKSRINRLNNIYKEELGNSEIVLRNVGGDPYKYQLKIKPKGETLHPTINRFSDVGEEWTEGEIRAFIDGLEMAKIGRVETVVENQNKSR
jgi:hypothetical protein